MMTNNINSRLLVTPL